MDKDKLKEQMINMKKEMLADLDKQLCDETNKPHKYWDCKKITELSEAIYEISCDDNNEIENRRENSKRKLIQKMNETKTPVRRKTYWRYAVPAFCLLVVLGLNTASLSVFGMNIFSAVHHIAKGNIIIDVEPDDTGIEAESSELEHYEIEDNNYFLSAYSHLIGEPDIVIDAVPDETTLDIKPSTGDTYGIKAKCAEYGLFPDVPEYIPDGFRLIHVEDKHYVECDIISFEYTNSNELVTFNFTVFKSADYVPDTKSYVDKYNFSEKEINGHTAYVIEESRKFSAFYLDDCIQYEVYSKNIDYDECYKILESLS